LQAALDDREGDGRVDAADERTIAELRRLRWLVDRAVIVEDLPDDPAVVELGKAVTVRDGQGVVEQYLIVHPVEAPLMTRGSQSARR
jgi:transcription elongation GreA/GreB family factor